MDQEGGGEITVLFMLSTSPPGNSQSCYAGIEGVAEIADVRNFFVYARDAERAIRTQQTEHRG